MQGFLVDAFGLDPTIARIVQLVVAFAVVVVAIVLGLWGFSRLTRRLRGIDEDGPSRLLVADVVPVDQKRRLILIRRDDVEHLVLIGGPSDIVVESGIRRTPARQSTPARPAEPPRTVEPRQMESRDEYAASPRGEPSLDDLIVEPAPRAAAAEPLPTARREPPPIDQVRPPSRG